MTRSVLQKLVDDPAIDIDFQHDEAEVHHTPTNDRRETAEAGATQLAGIRVAARHDREDEGPPAEGEVRKCLNAAFSFPQDFYSFLQDMSFERAKDVQEFQDAVLSLIRRGGFGLDGQDAAELAFADKTYKEPPPKEVGETAEAFLGLATLWN